MFTDIITQTINTILRQEGLEEPIPRDWSRFFAQGNTMPFITKDQRGFVEALTFRVTEHLLKTGANIELGQIARRFAFAKYPGTRASSTDHDAHLFLLIGYFVMTNQDLLEPADLFKLGLYAYQAFPDRAVSDFFALNRQSPGVQANACKLIRALNATEPQNTDFTAGALRYFLYWCRDGESPPPMVDTVGPSFVLLHNPEKHIENLFAPTNAIPMHPRFLKANRKEPSLIVNGVHDIGTTTEDSQLEMGIQQDLDHGLSAVNRPVSYFGHNILAHPAFTLPVAGQSLRGFLAGK